MSKKTEPARPEARLPKGLSDISAGEIRASEDDARHDQARVRDPTASSRSTRRRSNIPTRSASSFPTRTGRTRACSRFKDDDEQWLSLRYDLTAPLARYVAENYQNLPKPFRRYQVGPGMAEREAGAGALPPVHPVRRRHGRRLVGRRRRRALHARRRHARSARRPARTIRGEGQQPQNSRRRPGGLRRDVDIANASPSCAPSTSSTGSALMA